MRISLRSSPSTANLKASRFATTSPTIYVKFREEEHVANVVRDLARRFYVDRPVIMDFLSVTDFQGVTCRQYEKNICNRHGCNFMHLKRISWDLRHQLFGKHHKRNSNSKSRYKHHSHDKQSHRNIVESTMTGTTIMRVVIGNARVRVLNLEEEVEVRDGGSTTNI